jgi:hypothetical protein
MARNKSTFSSSMWIWTCTLWLEFEHIDILEFKCWTTFQLKLCILYCVDLCLKWTFLHLVVTFVCRDHELVSKSVVLTSITYHLFKNYETMKLSNLSCEEERVGVFSIERNWLLSERWRGCGFVLGFKGFVHAFFRIQ